MHNDRNGGLGRMFQVRPLGMSWFLVDEEVSCGGILFCLPMRSLELGVWNFSGP